MPGQLPLVFGRARDGAATVTSRAAPQHPQARTAATSQVRGDTHGDRTRRTVSAAGVGDHAAARTPRSRTGIRDQRAALKPTSTTVAGAHARRARSVQAPAG
jgi:hypothetical protein